MHHRCTQYRHRTRGGNSVFGTPVGEPRGVGTQLVYGSLTGLYCIWCLTRPFDWIIDCSIPVLLGNGPVLLTYGPVLLRNGPVLLNYGPFLDLPHASLLVRPQNRVLLLIPSKTV